MKKSEINRPDHWSGISNVWKQVGSPLRPSEENLDFFTSILNSWYQNHCTPPNVLILGVTPEIYHLPWPEGTIISAADHTQKMIDALWPGPRENVYCTDWLNLPFESQSFDLIFCDGGLHLLNYPNGQHKLVKSIRNLLTTYGQAVFRLFIPQVEMESVHRVVSDLLEAKIPNLNILKYRLWFALQKDKRKGVCLHDVWKTVTRINPDLVNLANNLGWPIEHLMAINSYKSSNKRYYFLSLIDIKEMFCEDPGGFQIAEKMIPEYELGTGFPTVVFNRK